MPSIACLVFSTTLDTAFSGQHCVTQHWMGGPHRQPPKQQLVADDPQISGPQACFSARSFPPVWMIARSVHRPGAFSTCAIASAEKLPPRLRMSDGKRKYLAQTSANEVLPWSQFEAQESPYAITRRTFLISND